MSYKNDDMAGVWFIVIFVIVLVAWTLLHESDKSYLKDPYFPDEGRSGCTIMPSGDCV